MFTSPVPLVEFYSQLLPAARRAGYKVVLTALAREADSPSFYADVKRYWTSLDDLTGPQMLFVFAGTNAAGELAHHGGLESRRDSVIYYAPDMAMRGKNDWLMKWNDRGDRYGSLLSFEDYLDRRYLGCFPPPRREPHDSLPMNHTSELFELKQFMGINEKQLPCLVFTLFNPDSHETGYGQRVVVPFSTFAHQTTYLFLKRVMEVCEPQFQFIDAAEKEQRHLLQKKERLESLRSVFGARAAVLSEVERLSMPDLKNAVSDIIALSEKPGRTAIDRSQCFTRLETTKRKLEIPLTLVSRLQRLIDLSFPRYKPVTSEDPDAATLFNTPQGIQTRLDELSRQIRLAWNRVTLSISEEENDSSVSVMRWDFFIAYAKPDEWWAERLYHGLCKMVRPFLDKFCLLPGDRWTQTIRAAHNQSTCTILVITDNTPNSWYAESEYLHAISMARISKHKVVPILCGKPSEVPYGLEQLQALSINEHSDMSFICGKLVEVLRQVEATQ